MVFYVQRSAAVETSKNKRNFHEDRVRHDGSNADFFRIEGNHFRFAIRFFSSAILSSKTSGEE